MTQNDTNPFASGGPYLMGIVNVTPDSFSDGGAYLDPEAAIAHGLRLLEEGADILDIGGESTRPGAVPVPPEEEIRRVLPVIEGLRGKARWLSIDTRHALTMEKALTAGANIINDVSALSHDPRSLDVAKSVHAPIIAMHAQGTPHVMQKNPHYNNVIEDIFEWMYKKLVFFETHKIEKKRVIFDPGIGFGKTLEHNLLIIRNISRFKEIGCPILLGASRKSFIAALDAGAPFDRRIGGSLAAGLHAVDQSVDILRVHDILETRQAIRVHSALSKP